MAKMIVFRGIFVPFERKKTCFIVINWGNLTWSHEFDLKKKLPWLITEPPPRNHQLLIRTNGHATETTQKKQLIPDNLFIFCHKFFLCHDLPPSQQQKKTASVRERIPINFHHFHQMVGKISGCAARETWKLMFSFVWVIFLAGRGSWEWIKKSFLWAACTVPGSRSAL